MQTRRHLLGANLCWTCLRLWGKTPTLKVVTRLGLEHVLGMGKACGWNGGRGYVLLASSDQ